MQSEATITFTQPGVQPPVYVVTSLSTPPWAPLELKPSKEKTPSGDFVFEQKFGNVAEGSYQYKIRIGEGHWVVDESKESATDEQGNRNNVVHAKPANSHLPLDHPANVKDTLDRKDSTIDTGDEKPGPIPFVVVEKVEDKDQPEYGDVAPKSLSVDESKRAADPEPDFEQTKTDSPLDTEPLKSAEAPLVMVEKVDDKPAHRDDFGEDVTKGQKVTHKLSPADVSPDGLTVSPEGPDELEPEDAQAPLFRHESFQDSEASLPDPSMDTIEEESVQSSTDHTSSGDIINTPSAESQDDLQDEDELGHGPLLSHETGFTDTESEFEKAPLLSHETGLGAKEDDEDDEFTKGPLLPHETGFAPQAKHDDSDYDEDEFDAAPLLPHETGFSSYKGSEAASRSSRLAKDEYDYEPEHYTQYGDHSDDGKDFGELDHTPTFSHEQDLPAEDYGAPLLPHERGSAAESFSGSERSFSTSPTMYEGAHPAFGQETDTAKELFGGSMRPSFFRTHTSSSTLPNKLPRSDAEDTDLHDPGLEIFPVGREQILERVATIGHKLPEDETHDVPTSPQPSVLSQACSSVDLVPVKSYISLASVREDEEEEDEEDNADVESLGSPVIMSRSSARFARDRDPLATPHPDDSKQLGFVPENKPEMQNTHTAESSEANSVSKTDGAKDSPKGLTSLPDIVASKATVMNTLTPPLTPRTLEALGKEHSPPVPESELRQRREPAKEAVENSAPTPQPEDNKDEDVAVAAPPMVTSAAEKLKLKKSSVQSWKEASIGVTALVAVGAVYYYLAVVR
ncbi:hypothetical protein BU25DRAFT_457003 [Macroventuria anomochaeta]|uniref:Uncharacterized protein n=1 Tax=Macroventuria anomochaeta TaxID=301207 RepID=A0ACB6S5R6_9PLEO|nr:uncharacterized protein BU25DRAFT_457003 [Macroventuria anomochaeta]KAF2629327.1 hypothetical protein BU25DRAFT_457003 [Macroventuria anomochaeta]